MVSRYNLELLWIVDDNFLVDIPRAVAIGEGLVRRGVKFSWSIQATTNLVARLEADEVKLLRRAGLKQICMGAESASPKILKLMNKGFQDIEGIHGAAEKCLAGGINPSFNIILGIIYITGQQRHDLIQYWTWQEHIKPLEKPTGMDSLSTNSTPSSPPNLLPGHGLSKCAGRMVGPARAAATWRRPRRRTAARCPITVAPVAATSASRPGP